MACSAEQRYVGMADSAVTNETASAESGATVGDCAVPRRDGRPLIGAGAAQLILTPVFGLSALIMEVAFPTGAGMTRLFAGFVPCKRSVGL